MSQTRIGYFGVDHSHRDGYLQSLKTVSGTIPAVYDPTGRFDVESIPHLESVRVYREYDSLLDDEDLDVAWVTLPNRDAPEVIEAAAACGLDVFSEKPMARSAVDLRSVAKTADRADVDVCVGYMWRHHPASVDLRRYVRNDGLGEVEAVNARWFASNLDARLESETGQFLYDAERSGGGILHWLGCHWIDLILWTLQERIERVNANLVRDHPSSDIETNATVEFETESGVTGTLHAGYLLPWGYDTEINVYGSRGTTKSHRRGPTTPDGKSTLFLDTDVTTVSGLPQRTIEYNETNSEGYFGDVGRSYITSFLHNRSSGDLASLQDAVKVLQVLDAIHASDAEQNWVSVERSEYVD